MTGPLAYLDGQFIPAEQARISVADAGFVQGATVSEQLRTFGGELFQLDSHLDRLQQSLRIIEIELPLSRAQLDATAHELVAHNGRLLEPGDDLGLSMFVTPGLYATMAMGETLGPTLALHTYPLPFANWADKYCTGDALTVVDIRQVPTASWPATMKCRSRMHYALAERQARQRTPGSRPLLLDEYGFVNETPTANIVMLKDSQWITPPASRTLSGISQRVLWELAQRDHFSKDEAEVAVEPLLNMDEIILTSTPFCALPVTSVNGRPIADGKVGDAFRRLIARWSERVGLDVIAQAKRFRSR